jgi:hypothetical protein
MLEFMGGLSVELVCSMESHHALFGMTMWSMVREANPGQRKSQTTLCHNHLAVIDHRET